MRAQDQAPPFIVFLLAQVSCHFHFQLRVQHFCFHTGKYLGSFSTLVSIYVYPCCVLFVHVLICLFFFAGPRVTASEGRHRRVRFGKNIRGLDKSRPTVGHGPSPHPPKPQDCTSTKWVRFRTQLRCRQPFNLAVSFRFRHSHRVVLVQNLALVQLFRFRRSHRVVLVQILAFCQLHRCQDLVLACQLYFLDFRQVVGLRNGILAFELVNESQFQAYDRPQRALACQHLSQAHIGLWGLNISMP